MTAKIKLTLSSSDSWFRDFILSALGAFRVFLTQNENQDYGMDDGPGKNSSGVQDQIFITVSLLRV
jgi:hypothetical protein